jgi:signal transduction histidine kinase
MEKNAQQERQSEGASNSGTQKRVIECRAYLFFGGWAHISFGIALNYFFPKVYDPIWLRCALAICFWSVLAWSYKNKKKFIPQIDNIFAMIAGLSIMLVGWVTASSGNNPAWVMGWFMTVILCLFILDTLKRAGYFMIFATIWTIAFNAQVENSLMPIPYMFVLLICSVLLIYFNLQHRIHLIDTLRDQKDLILRQSKELDDQRALSFNSAKLASLGEVAGGIAHEINNPLAIMQGQVFLLKKQVKAIDESPKTLKRCDDITSNIQRIAKIIKGIKSFSRDASNDPVEDHALKELIADSMGLFEQKVSAHNIELKIDLGEVENGIIACRPVEISQVLVNLVTNAVHALEELPDEETKWITLSARREDGYILLAVSNSGPKIDSAIVEKVFQPFFTTKDPGKGTGLGLSVSKGIVDSHGGKFFVDEAAEHTSFVVALPSNISN